MLYKSIIILSDSDPFNEETFVAANVTLEHVIEVYLNEKRKETGVVIVHDGEAFTCLGRLAEVELQIGVNYES